MIRCSTITLWHIRCRERASSTTSFASVWLDHGDFRSTPANGHRQNNGISQERQSGSASLGNRSLGRTADSHSGEQRSRLDSGSPEETPLPHGTYVEISAFVCITGDTVMASNADIFFAGVSNISPSSAVRTGVSQLTIEYLSPVEFERKVGLA